MLTHEALQTILDDYTEQIVPVMYRSKYHLRLAKGGPDFAYLPEQSFFVHLINGVFGLARLLTFIIEHKIVVRGLDEQMVRKAVALFCVHDVHKLGGFEQIGSSEFSIPLERLRQEWDVLGLTAFAGDVDEHLMRAINVSRRSPYQGDLLLSDDPQANKLWLLKSIADNMASAKNPLEAVSSLEGTDYLKSLAPEFGTSWRLYAHELRDIRGVVTNLIHGATGAQLQQQFGFFDLLHFPTGTLYLGPKRIAEFERGVFITTLVDDVLNGLQPEPDLKKSYAAEGLRRKNFDFQSYVYSFADIGTLLEIVLEETQRTKPDAKSISDDVAQIARKDKTPEGWADQFEKRFEVSLNESKAFNEHWSLARRYLLYVDTLLHALSPQQDRLAWYAETFGISVQTLTHLREDEKLLASGGPGKHIVVPAYHFLRGAAFVERSAEATDIQSVIAELHTHTLKALQRVDTQEGRLAAIEELGFRADLQIYLDEHLSLSLAPEAHLPDDALADYANRKKKGHSPSVCSICNRVSEYTQPLRTDVLGDFGRVFSNRVLPASEAPGGLRPWCPICHLEFIFRRFAGLAVAGAYEQSYRINLYVFPAFSFTPYHTQLLDKLLKPLREVSTVPVRDYGPDSIGVPRQWIARRELDPEWVDAVQTVLDRESARIAARANYVGETLRTARTLQANYLLAPWEKAVRDREKDDALIPTHTEAWAKATYIAAIIASLTGCRVFVTPRPYMPIADPSELKATVTLDAPPAAIAKLLGNEQDQKLKAWTDSISLYGIEEGRASGLERALDLFSALWVVTAEVHKAKGSTKDKHIAERLGELMTNPLAGAHFYKEYARLNEDATPFPTLATACAILIEHLGGLMKDIVQQLSDLSLRIWEPDWKAGRGKAGRGKAHDYEWVFRETVTAIQNSFALIPESRAAIVTGKPLPPEALEAVKKIAAGTVLKGLQRRLDRRDGYFPELQQLAALVGEFVALVVDEIFVKRAGGSVSQFVRLENRLADGLYYLTDRYKAKKFEERKAEKANQTASA